MPSPRLRSLDIALPEGVILSLPLAGPATRFLAWLTDWFLTMALVLACSRFIGPLAVLSPDVALALQIILFFAIPILYGILFEGFWRGRTPGKWALGLRVMDAGGLRLDLRQVIVRNLLRGADLLPLLYLVGGMACLLTRRAQRLGDLAAGTVVVRTERAAPPDLAQLAPGKYNTLRGHPVLIARLHQRIGPAEAGVALQALLRRNFLEPRVRGELFALLAARFRAAVPLPAGLDEELTDEQHVRNIVEVLFQARGSRWVADPAAESSRP